MGRICYGCFNCFAFKICIRLSPASIDESYQCYTRKNWFWLKIYIQKMFHLSKLTTLSQRKSTWSEWIGLLLLVWQRHFLITPLMAQFPSTFGSQNHGVVFTWLVNAFWQFSFVSYSIMFLYTWYVTRCDTICGLNTRTNQ